MADISKIKLPNGSECNIKDANALPKTTYEWNKEISFGASGKLLIGKFPCYDSNVTVSINSSTSTTYHATAIMATQNINTSGGGSITWNTYGDSANTVTPNLYAKYASGSNVIEIYFSPLGWSKNLIHIQCNGLAGAPTNICENVSEIPSTATRQPTNTFTTKLADYLPKSGGTISSSSASPLIINSSAANETGISFQRNGTTKGWIGYHDSYGVYLYNNARGKYLNYTNDGKLNFEGNVVWHAGNDGAGSGLDADTLDGQHASTFAPINSPAFTGTPTAPTATAGTNTTQIATTAFVKTAIDNMPEPMLFKGSVGTDGTVTWANLPSAAAANEGWTYKVITAHSADTKCPACKVGDTIISNGTAWTVIPSGDEPSGTVTSVATGIGLTGGAITSSGTIKAKLKDETLNSADSSKSTSTSGGLYSIEADKSGNLAVRVPWTDHTYTVNDGTFTVKTKVGSNTAVSVVSTSANASGNSDVTLIQGTNVTLTTDTTNRTVTIASTDTKNTAGSTDTSSKIFLIGATSQAANPQTYSDNEVYATSGVVTTKSVQVGGTSATMQYNSTLEAIEFTFS